MTEHTDNVLHSDNSVQLGSLNIETDALIERATSIATALAKVVNDRNLFTPIQGKKYVRVEGWNTLGALIGVLPREVSCKPIENGYEAVVELIRTSDGLVVGGASAICTRDEKNWGSRDDYAVRSMAITRATGKAFRLGFSWIMKLAGYEPTPAEEMPVEAEYREAPKARTIERPLSPETLRAFMAKKAAKHEGDKSTPAQFGLAMGTLNLCFAGDANSDDKRHSVLFHLFGKDTGKDLADGEVLALLDWLKPTREREGEPYLPDGMAAREAQAAAVAGMQAKGQKELMPETDDAAH